jgi:hypothetical protein
MGSQAGPLEAMVANVGPLAMVAQAGPLEAMVAKVGVVHSPRSRCCTHTS